jgi:ferredoxin-NADP reductase
MRQYSICTGGMNRIRVKFIKESRDVNWMHDDRVMNRVD